MHRDLLAGLRVCRPAVGRAAPSLLLVLQGMDASGKDGTIRRVLRVQPQGCRVTSFKAPSGRDAAHDFLWRVHGSARHGEMGIFNRSH